MTLECWQHASPNEFAWIESVVFCIQHTSVVSEYHMVAFHMKGHASTAADMYQSMLAWHDHIASCDYREGVKAIVHPPHQTEIGLVLEVHKVHPHMGGWVVA